MIPAKLAGMIRRAALLLVLIASSAAAQTFEPPAPDRGTVQKRDGFRDAAMAPLEDLNVKRTQIPDVLNRAVAEPYAMAGLTTCEAIAGEIGRLDAALGPDLDEAPPLDRRTRMEKVGSAAREAGVSAVRGEAQGALPFRGWVRRLTGANKHDKQVQAAIRNGGVRRGYLKGVGMQKNCAPPAAPSWFTPVRIEAPKAAAAPERGATGLMGMLIRIFAWLRSLLPF